MFDEADSVFKGHSWSGWVSFRRARKTFKGQDKIVTLLTWDFKHIDAVQGSQCYNPGEGVRAMGEELPQTATWAIGNLNISVIQRVEPFDLWSRPFKSSFSIRNCCFVGKIWIYSVLRWSLFDALITVTMIWLIVIFPPQNSHPLPEPPTLVADFTRRYEAASSVTANHYEKFTFVSVRCWIRITKVFFSKKSNKVFLREGTT
jgi:hypothetical protein